MEFDRSIKSIVTDASSPEGERHQLMLLIPAYNEEDRISSTLLAYWESLKNNFEGAFKIVVVINGCRDRTEDVVRSVAIGRPEIAWMVFEEAIGKGGALIEGLRLAPEADLIGYVDADGATPPRAFLDLVQVCEQPEVDCSIGSRWISGSIVTQKQPNHRRFMSRCFHLMIQTLFRMGIRDTQCGAKVIKRVAVESIHDALRIADMAFDLNLLYALKRHGFRIVEHPTEWEDQLGSKVRIGKTSLVMALSAIRLRLVYSPFYRWLRPFRPLEAWVYRKLLKSPSPRPGRSKSN
jgi:glycosyltransferase involved in cell wall biosynthesis